MKNKIIKFSVAVPVILSLFFAIEAHASTVIATWGATNYGGNVGYTLTSRLATSTDWYFICNSTSIPLGVDQVGQAGYGYTTATTSLAHEYKFTVPSNDTYMTNGAGIGILASGLNPIGDCNGSNDLVFSSVSNLTPSLTWFNPVNLQHKFSGDFIDFGFTFENFSTSTNKYYQATVYYSTPTESTNYQYQTSNPLNYQSGVATGTALISFFPQNLYIPSLGSTTEWSAYANLYEGTTLNGSSSRILAYTTPTITFSVSPNYASTTQIWNDYLTHWSDTGYRVDNNGFMVDYYNRFVDRFGNPTSTGILAPTSTILHVDICSGDYDVPLFSSGTMRMIACTSKDILKSIIDWIFVPPKFVTDIWSEQIQHTKEVPPFNIVWGVVTAFQQTASSTSANSLNYNDLKLDIPEAHINTQILSADMVKTWLTTSHCDATCAQGRKDTIFNWITAIIWLGAGIKILTFIF